MALQIDEIDSKIIWNLDHDARMSLSDLGRRVGISKQAASYRLKKLIEAGVLSGFISMVDIHHLGFLTYRIYLRYHTVTPEEEARVIEYLTELEYTLWVVSTAGIWDVEVVFTARNFIHFNNILKKLRQDIGKYISKYNISMSIVSYHFKRDYLINSSREDFPATYYGFEPQPGKWSELDLAILTELAQNCRQTNEAIGRKLGVTYQTIKHRLRRLEEGGILQCHRILIDLAKIGRQYHKVLLSLKTATAEEEEALYHFCAKRNFVIYLTEVLGEWQLEIETEVSSRDQVIDLLRELRIRFPHLISDYEILQVTKEHKMNYFPMGRKFPLSLKAQSKNKF